jgi:hypothetical protein
MRIAYARNQVYPYNDRMRFAGLLILTHYFHSALFENGLYLFD